MRASSSVLLSTVNSWTGAARFAQRNSRGAMWQPFKNRTSRSVNKSIVVMVRRGGSGTGSAGLSQGPLLTDSVKWAPAGGVGADAERGGRWSLPHSKTRARLLGPATCVTGKTWKRSKCRQLGVR